MQVKTFLSIALLSCFQTFFAQEIKTETQKSTADSTAVLSKTISAEKQIADEKAKKESEQLLRDKLKAEKEALKQAEKREKEQKAFEKEKKAFEKNKTK